jgi:hypothetical protein
LSLEDGDIIRLVVASHTTANAQPALNVFWYQVGELTGAIDTPDTLKATAGQMFVHLATNMAAVQSNALVYDSALLDNMTNLIDTAEYVPLTAFTGSLAYVSNPTQLALSFKLVRTNRTTRNGSKRVGGIGLNMIGDTTGAALASDARVLSIQAAFNVPINIDVDDGNTCRMHPVIVRRPATGSPVTIFQAVSDCIYRGAGSQNTRKQLL